MARTLSRRREGTVHRLSSQSDGAQASGGHTIQYNADQLGRKGIITYTTDQ